MEMNPNERHQKVIVIQLYRVHVAIGRANTFDNRRKQISMVAHHDHQLPRNPNRGTLRLGKSNFVAEECTKAVLSLPARPFIPPIRTGFRSRCIQCRYRRKSVVNTRRGRWVISRVKNKGHNNTRTNGVAAEHAFTIRHSRTKTISIWSKMHTTTCPPITIANTSSLFVAILSLDQ